MPSFAICASFSTSTFKAQLAERPCAFGKFRRIEGVGGFVDQITRGEHTVQNMIQRAKAVFAAAGLAHITIIFVRLGLSLSFSLVRYLSNR